jgi:cysteine desulfurase
MTVYLDHAATTPLRPEALEAMLPFLTEQFGNPSSPHALGRRARAALDEAHERIAARLGADAREIVITSGGTESINLALKGAAWAGRARGHRIVTTPIEHHAVGHSLAHLDKFGFEIVEVPVDRYGRVDPDDLERALTDRTILVSVMAANNEVGTIQPIADVARVVRARKGILLHVDAVQAAPYLPIDVGSLDVDLLSISAHKLEGPKGVGALYLRKGTHILPQQHGGSQERYRRAGTEDVAGAVGLSVALDLGVREQVATTARLRKLRDRLRQAVLAVDGVELTGHARERLPGHLSVVVRDADGASVVIALDLAGIAASTVSACATGSTEPSHVLTAMGYPADEAVGALRLSLGRTTTEADVATAIEVVPPTIARIRTGATEVAADPLGQATPA